MVCKGFATARFDSIALNSSLLHKAAAKKALGLPGILIILDLGGQPQLYVHVYLDPNLAMSPETQANI